MGALDRDTTRVLLEIVASLYFSVLVGILFFRVFFEGWLDYFQCSSRFSRFLKDRDDWAYNSMRGFAYHFLVIGSGVGAYYLMRKFGG